MENYLKEYMLNQLKTLIDIPSPTGYTAYVQKYLMETLENMGFEPYTLHKGGVICCLGEKETGLCWRHMWTP